jgi:hypothetical protein
MSKTLQSGQRYYWQVKVWDANKMNRYECSIWDMGLCSLITGKQTGYNRYRIPRGIFRVIGEKKFCSKKKIATAKFMLPAMVFTTYFNGKKQVMSTYPLDLPEKITIPVYDVSDMLQQGNNADWCNAG